MVSGIDPFAEGEARAEHERYRDWPVRIGAIWRWESLAAKAQLIGKSR